MASLSHFSSILNKCIEPTTLYLTLHTYFAFLKTINAKSRFEYGGSKRRLPQRTGKKWQANGSGNGGCRLRFGRREKNLGSGNMVMSLWRGCGIFRSGGFSAAGFAGAFHQRCHELRNTCQLINSVANRFNYFDAHQYRWKRNKSSNAAWHQSATRRFNHPGLHQCHCKRNESAHAAWQYNCDRRP